MMFSCCHPRLPEEAQVTLILNILCSLGTHEIGSEPDRAAVSRETIEHARESVANLRPPSPRRGIRQGHKAVTRSLLPTTLRQAG